MAVCALVRASGCLTGWTLVAAETTRSGADVGAFPALFRTRPGERASPINLITLGLYSFSQMYYFGGGLVSALIVSALFIFFEVDVRVRDEHPLVQLP